MSAIGDRDRTFRPTTISARDRALMKRLAAGDRAAYTELWGHYHYRLYRKALGVLSRGQKMLELAQRDADEAAADTMMRVWVYAKKYDPDEAAPSTYIYRILLRRCFTIFERRRRRPEWFPPWGKWDTRADASGEGYRDTFWDRVVDPSTVRPSDHRYGPMLSYLAGLHPDEYRRCYLYHGLGWTATRIAIVDGTTPTAIRSQIQRDRKVLREAAVARYGISAVPGPRGVPGMPGRCTYRKPRRRSWPLRRRNQ